jgi:hypothetical protein
MLNTVRFIRNKVSVSYVLVVGMSSAAFTRVQGCGKNPYVPDNSVAKSIPLEVKDR